MCESGGGYKNAARIAVYYRWSKNLKSLANSLCSVRAEIHSYEEGFTRLIDCSVPWCCWYLHWSARRRRRWCFICHTRTVMRSRICSLHLTPASTKELWATDWILTVEYMFLFVGETGAPRGNPSRERRTCKPHTVSSFPLGNWTQESANHYGSAPPCWKSFRRTQYLQLNHRAEAV